MNDSLRYIILRQLVDRINRPILCPVMTPNLRPVGSEAKRYKTVNLLFGSERVSSHGAVL